MRKYTTKSLCDRVEYLDAEVDRLAARLLALEARQVPQLTLEPGTTVWSYPDGDAPWNPNYRTPLGPLSFADDKEYEPEERIRGQFK
jgi:hypothetical protein